MVSALFHLLVTNTSITGRMQIIKSTGRSKQSKVYFWKSSFTLQGRHIPFPQDTLHMLSDQNLPLHPLSILYTRWRQQTIHAPVRTPRDLGSRLDILSQLGIQYTSFHLNIGKNRSGYKCMCRRDET